MESSIVGWGPVTSWGEGSPAAWAGCLAPPLSVRAAGTDMPQASVALWACTVPDRHCQGTESSWPPTSCCAVGGGCPANPRVLRGAWQQLPSCEIQGTVSAKLIFSVVGSSLVGRLFPQAWVTTLAPLISHHMFLRIRAWLSQAALHKLCGREGRGVFAQCSVWHPVECVARTCSPSGI